MPYHILLFLPGLFKYLYTFINIFIIFPAKLCFFICLIISHFCNVFDSIISFFNFPSSRCFLKYKFYCSFFCSNPYFLILRFRYLLSLFPANESKKFLRYLGPYRNIGRKLYFQSRYHNKKLYSYRVDDDEFLRSLGLNLNIVLLESIYLYG